MRQTEEIYRTLFEKMDESFCIIQLLYNEQQQPVNWIYCDLNPAFQKNIGFQNAIDKTILELTPDIEPKWFAIYGRVATTGEPIRLEDYSAALGRWFSLYAFRVGEPQEAKVAVLFTDITHQKQSQQALLASEARQQAILNSAKDYAIFTTDLAHRITSWSRGAQAVFGYGDADILNQPVDWLYVAADRQAGVAAGEAQIAIQVGEAYNERWHIRQDGSLFYGSGVVTPLRDETGTIQGLLKVMRDLTPQKQAEEALHLANRRKNEFLAMLAHELRNPMATIRNGLQILSQPGIESQAAQTTLAMMSRQTDHLARLVDDLLDMSRIEQGKISLQKQRVDLVDLVSQAGEGVRPLYEERGRQLQMQLPTAPLYIDGDATRLIQVVTNLLTNGARYTLAQGQVSLSLTQEGQQAMIQVGDDGIGLAADQLGTIFELFVQVDNSLARSQGGLGLGLTLVKTLVEGHQGQVEAQSEGLGQGSTFTIHLPLLPMRSPTPAPPVLPSSSPDPVDRPRLLIIDDNADAALTLAMLLKLKGYEVHTRTDGRSGLVAVEQLKPQAVLLDIGMSGLDGYQTCQLLRLQGWGEQVIVIALTGYGQAEDRQRTRAAGFDAHLVKPVDLTVLLNLLIALLAQPR